MTKRRKTNNKIKAKKAKRKLSTSTANGDEPRVSLVWGGENIARALGLRTKHQAYHLHKLKAMPGLGIVGGRLCLNTEIASREAATTAT